MSDANEDPTPPEDLSDTLIQRIDALELSELKSLRSYIERRIESSQAPFEAEVEADSEGEILNIENHGGYALVRMHPPNSDGSGVNREKTSLYHVRREHLLDGTDSLNWAYLGDMAEK